MIEKKEGNKSLDNKSDKIQENGNISSIRLLFNQLIKYFRFRRRFDELLENDSEKNNINLNQSLENNKSNETSKNKIFNPQSHIQNRWCLIDKSWINKWKKHIGYQEIIQLIKKNEIKESDYENIKPIIQRHSSENRILPLDMSRIYENNNLNILSDFDIIYLKLFEEFSVFIPPNVKDNPIIYKCYSIKISKNKYIIKLDSDIFQIVFLEKSLKNYIELLIIFQKKSDKNNQGKSKIIKEIETEDINDWLKKHNIQIISYKQKEINVDSYNIIIINKTEILKSNRQTNIVFNSVKPFNHHMNETFNEFTVVAKAFKQLIENQEKENKQYFYQYSKSLVIEKNAKMLIAKNINKDNNTIIKEDSFINKKTVLFNKDNNEKLDNNNEKKQGKNINNETKINIIKAIPQQINNISISTNSSIEKSETKVVLKGTNKKLINNQNSGKESHGINFNNNRNNLNQNNYGNNNIQNINQNIINNNINNYNHNLYNNINQNFISSNHEFNNNNNNNDQIQNNFNQMNFNNNNQNCFTNQQNWQSMDNNNNIQGNFNFNGNNNIFSFQNNNNYFNGFNGSNYFNNNIINFNNNFNINNNNQIVGFMPNMNDGFGLNSNNMMNQVQYQDQMFNINMQKNGLDINNNWNNNIGGDINKNMNNIINNNNFQFYNKNKKDFLIERNEDNLNGEILQKQNSIIEVDYPHLVGLKNIGQTCYMNSTLQCLSNISELSDYLINNFYHYNSNSHPLTTAYTNLLFKLLLNTDEKNDIDPIDFKKIVGDLNPLFQGLQAADSKDLLFFIIERLHIELNKTNNNINFIKDFNILEQESRDEEKMLKNFNEEFSITNNSIISNTFYGVTRSIMNCEECKVIKYSFQTFNMQIFELKKIKDGKIADKGSDFEKITLMDAFFYSQKEEELDGENMIYCNGCRKLTKTKHKQEFFSLPKILIIVLNRGKNNVDFNEYFDFPETLDFSEQNIILNKQSYMKYKLVSLITHLGESSSNGHFIAYVRVGKTNEFYCFNDTIVSKANLDDAIKQVISQKEEQKISPYILFYHCSE